MPQKILVIGATGMLARPVIRRMVKEGLTIRAMVRSVERARKILPEEVELVCGDLQDIPSISAAADGMEVVYLNLSTENFKAVFKPELDGTINTVAALQGREDILIAKLSGLSSKNDKVKWLDKEHKFMAEKVIMESGHPWLIFRASWFMESFPLMMQKGKFVIFGKQPYNWRWMAADDYGRMLTTAFKQNYRDRIFHIQGVENCSWDSAAKRFLQAYAPDNKIVHIPLWVLKAMGMFIPALQELYPLYWLMNSMEEPFFGTEAWDLLGKPEMTIEDYVKYMKETGDVPRKS